MIQEYVPGGDLYQLIKQNKRIKEKKAVLIFKGVFEGLQEMHFNNFVHRDLKLENIIVENKETLNCKLVDFGFAEIIN